MHRIRFLIWAARLLDDDHRDFAPLLRRGSRPSTRASQTATPDGTTCACSIAEPSLPRAASRAHCPRCRQGQQLAALTPGCPSSCRAAWSKRHLTNSHACGSHCVMRRTAARRARKTSLKRVDARKPTAARTAQESTSWHRAESERARIGARAAGRRAQQARKRTAERRDRAHASALVQDRYRAGA
jgi:hypothetical protein